MPEGGRPAVVPAGHEGRPRIDRPSLVLAVLLLGMGVALAVDASSITAPPGADSVGPSAFPWAVAVALLVLGVVLGLVSFRGRPDEDWAAAFPQRDDEVRDAVEPVQPPGAAERPVGGGGGRPLLRARPAVRVLVFAAGLIAHALLIGTAGYVVAALVLFLAVAVAFGAPRPVRVLLIGLTLALVIFYSFTLGLGLALPNLGGR